jgi:hypothetical protein
MRGNSGEGKYGSLKVWAAKVRKTKKEGESAHAQAIIHVLNCIVVSFLRDKYLHGSSDNKHKNQKQQRKQQGKNQGKNQNRSRGKSKSESKGSVRRRKDRRVVQLLQRL